jgi:hypothetical protein
MWLELDVIYSHVNVLRRDKTSVGIADFEDAQDRVIAGLERSSSPFSKEEKKIIAYHEVSLPRILDCLVDPLDIRALLGVSHKIRNGRLDSVVVASSVCKTDLRLGIL